jgi:hypothetical protein
VGVQPDGSSGCRLHGAHRREQVACYRVFVIEVKGNYSVILGSDKIHDNRCIPCTLHEFLIQCIDDEIKVVHVDTSSYIALADTIADW